MSFGITALETGITPPRLGNIMAYSFFVHELPGDFVEFGVCQGGSLELLAKLHPTKKIYGIDGFNGLPEPGPEDVHVKGDFALTEYEFGHLNNWLKYNHPNVEIIRGYSPGAFQFIPSDTQFSFVHVDVDLFSSVNHALHYFFPRMVEGGMMLFDDFGYDTTPGATKALNEFNQHCKWKGPLTFANDIFCGQYLIIK